MSGYDPYESLIYLAFCLPLLSTPWFPLDSPLLFTCVTMCYREIFLPVGPQFSWTSTMMSGYHQLTHCALLLGFVIVLSAMSRLISRNDPLSFSEITGVHACLHFRHYSVPHFEDSTNRLVCLSDSSTFSVWGGEKPVCCAVRLIDWLPFCSHLSRSTNLTSYE